MKPQRLPLPGPLPRCCVLACALAFVPGPAAAQQETSRTVVTAAGEQYRAGAFHRLILGRHYRDLWTLPMEVEVLDLETFAGGLQPLRTGGGMQTRSLRFLAANGREYSFRSVDKDPSAVLDSILVGTVVDDLVQDGISAAHPLGALVAAPLLDAVGILHADPQLLVMPDDPSLGEFREEFAGMLGLIEERPNENEGGATSFGGALRVIASETLTERLDRDPRNRVDARAFLTARIMDLFLGDWDRHRGQWRWATYDPDPDGHRVWVPVPRDRDQAFAKFDGLATRLVSLYQPAFVRFEEDYPSISRLHWNARALDRWFLSGLERPVWDSVGASVRARIDDAVIDEAVRRLPAEVHAVNGAELAATLRVRRDNLEEAWDAFYRLLARQVDLHATDADEHIVVHRSQGQVRVTVTATEYGSAPYLSRTFSSDETDELRIYARGGADRVELTGNADPGLTLRVVGGEGDDVFRVDPGSGFLRLYDSEGTNTASGAGLNTRHFEEWEWTPEDRAQPRDWGRRGLPIFWTSYSTDLGLFLGGGVNLDSYGFRKRPYASSVDIRGGFSPVESKGRLEVAVQRYLENSKVHTDVKLRLSGLDVIRYYGLGNDTEGAGGDFNKVDHRVASLEGTLGVTTEGWTFAAGALLTQTRTEENPGRFFGELRDSIYGADDFLRLGATVRLSYDPPTHAETGSQLRFSIGGTAFPKYLVDVERSYAKADAKLSALLTPSTSAPVSLVLTAGGAQAWGQFPFHDAAFLGGGETLRGWEEQRFAGDAAVYGSAEIRLRVAYPSLIVPVATGVFGFADVGRVYVDGASPGGWHQALGGGVWLKPVRQPYIVRIGVGVSDEATKVYIALGLPL